jgi:hypothetical protein
MTKSLKNPALLALSMLLLGCSKTSQPQPAPVSTQPAATNAPASPTPATSAPAVASAPEPSRSNGKEVKTEMRNVYFHLMEGAGAHIETLSGTMVAVGKYDMPVFDDKNSFEVNVVNGKVSISPEALGTIMNNYVFAKDDAPLKDLKVSIKEGRIIIKGRMKAKGDISFQTEGTLNANPDGRLRVHTEKVKALHVPVKGMMGMLGIDLASVVNTSKIDGLDTDKNDMLMDLGKLLPPPHMRGKVVAVKVENNAIVTFFGDGGKSAPVSADKTNYMSFMGGSVRFGNMIMESADLTVLDMDPGDPLDWNQNHYKQQLVAGYSKITPNFGLRAYVKDYAKIPRSAAAAAAAAAIAPPAGKN